MDPKELAALVQSAVDELHKAVERQDGEIKKLGAPTAETKAAIDKINTDITARLDEMEAKYQRQTIPGAGIAEPTTEEAKARSAAFFKYVRGGVTALNPDERKALVENDVGQYLITPELEMEIERTLPKITVVRPLATVRPIGKDRLKVRSISEVQVGWGKLETGTPITEGGGVPGVPTYQYAEDLYGLAKIGEDELQDSDFNLNALLADSFTRAIGEAEDLAFVIGTGHDNEQPMGITIDPTLILGQTDVATTNVALIEEYMAVMYACPAQYRRNGSWVVNSATELRLRQMRAVDGAGTEFGTFLWQPSLIADKPNTFLGHPIYNQDDIAAIAGAANVIAIFGDFKAGYRVIDRQGITLQRLVELYSEEGLVGFKVHKRVGGGVIKAANKPFVLLADIA